MNTSTQVLRSEARSREQLVGLGALTVVTLSAFSGVAQAQVIPPDRLGRVVRNTLPAPIEGGGRVTDISNACLPTRMLTGGKTYSVSGGTATIPVTFSRVEKGEDGKYHVGAAMDIGYGYTRFTGSGQYSDNGALDVSPEAFIGAAIGTGVRNNEGSVGGTLSATVFGGFRLVAVSAGYDFLAKSPIFGLASKIDLFRFKSGSGASLCVKEGF